MTTEAVVEKYLIAQVEAAGGRAIKLLPWSNVGLPDRLVLLPGGRVWFIETKRPTVEKLGRGQRKWRRYLEVLGMNYRMLHSKESIDMWMYSL